MTKQAMAIESPVFILKQAWEFCRKDFKKLGLIYIIFNLPITIITFFPIFNITAGQKLNLVQVMGSILLLIVNSWGHITLLLSTSKDVVGQNYSLGQSIKEAKNFLLKYIVLILSVVLIVLGFIVLVGIAATVIFPLLLKTNRIVGIIFGSLLVIGVIITLVFYTLRWSLSGLTCVFENLRPLAALKHSFALINKHTNRVVGVYGLIVLIYIVGLFPVILMGLLPGLGQSARSSFNMGVTIYTTLMNTVFVPFWVMSVVVLYKKLKEAL